ncbi:MAG TPA: CorA family divalent cation transporter [Bacteroidales bacterium]|jgi:magnesium transporter|nr:magnesium and cobalt transport protein CorA [Bacteroidales bacterium]HKM12797.1 CorA family divalent cation transporter [Bacteroidales bacterium]HPB88579.1 CorA family divalent cation transporter [Bacteroidales bacterium]HPY21217.1 CorA family divalent cation transporter [Bacteroidales bacterium]HQA92605.1 CorA family divalent cation transporter [Bacteroidales bacterium]
MIGIFYKSNDQIATSDNTDILNNLHKEDVLWIDLFDPTGEEKRSVEHFLNTNLQSRAQAEEIESSSRYSETHDNIFINTDFLIPGPENYSMESVSFMLTGDTITSIRQVPLRSFTDIQRRIIANPRIYPTGYHILIGILENRIDLDADMIELMSKEIAQYSKRVSLGEDVGEEFLLDINQLQENTMMVRENIVDKQRMLSSILKSEKSPDNITNKLNILLKDVASLINHTNFSFERLEYLQNTVLGLINLEQNKIMKIFTLVSLLLMPPTLIASIYGMNIKLPLIGGLWDILLLGSLMLTVVLVVIFIFRRRRML